MLRLLRGGLWFALILCLSSLVFRSYVLFQSKFYSSGAESIGLYGILDITEGKNLYRSPEERPYSIFVFTPLYPFVVGHWIKALRISHLATRVIAIKWVGIGLSFLLFFIFWWAAPKHSPPSLLISVLALTLSSSRLFDYIGTTRNDIAALVAELLALCFFSKYISSQKVKELLLFTFFSVLGVWTRQTATIVFFSGICWLLLNRKFKPALLSGFLWGMINLTVLFLLYQRFGPSLFDHILFSNIRVWKSFDSSLFTTSLFSYFASMIVFGGLLYSYFKRNRLEKNSIPQFYFLCLLIGSCVGSISYFRSGGDVNYLFFPVLAGTYFTLPILEHWMSRPFKLGLIVLQLVLISFVYFQKSKAALKYSQLPYPQMAQEIKSRYPGYGLIVGHYAQNMGIYLKDWAYHGPDLTNGTMLAYSAHLKLNWLVADAKSAIRENKITALVDANPNCALGPSLNGEWFLSFPKREILADWLCVYNRN